MVVNFNPSVSKINNAPKIAKNNNSNVAFKRAFTPKELALILDGTNASELNKLQRNAISLTSNPVTAKEAGPQLKELLKIKPNSNMVKFFAERLGVTLN